MIPSILLALTVIIAMIDVLVGIHRGFGFGIVRVLIWIAGVVVCFFLAEPVTIRILLKMAKVPDMKIFTFDVFGGFLGDTKESIGTHLSGTTVSFLIPIVFVALFILSKLITWIVYCIVKHIIKKTAKRAEAYNAALDAVKAIEHMELPESENTIEQSIPKPDFSRDEPEDFGTFGIYPKEEVKNSAGDNAELLESDISAAEGLGKTGGDASDSSDQNEETADGFETIAASSEDGFESLAKIQRLEDAESSNKKKPRRLKKRKSLSMLLIKESFASKVLGGILGLFVSLFACAIIMAPVTQIFNRISSKEDAEAVVDLAFTLSKTDTDGFFDRALEKRERTVPIIQKEIDLVGDISLRAEDFVEMFTEGDKSIVYSVYKYSGANLAASAIYDGLSEVDVRDIKLDNKGIQTYCFPDTLSCYLGLATPVKKMVDLINQGKGVGVELINDIKECFDYILSDRGKGEILTRSDKLALVNSFIDGMNERLKKSPIAASSENGVIVLEYFKDYDEMRSGLDSLFDLVKRLMSAGLLE